jgi:hypothetical protein
MMGTLNEKEDVGYEFRSWGADGIPNNSDDVLTRIGADNGRIDTENSNGGGFKTSDDPGFGTPLMKLSRLVSDRGDRHGSGWQSGYDF